MIISKIEFPQYLHVDEYSSPASIKQLVDHTVENTYMLVWRLKVSRY